jgi:hypothetical protein
MTDTISVASFLADFYALSTSASLDYMEYPGMYEYITLLTAYSNDADVYITRKNPPKIKQISSYKGCFHAA